MKILVLNCGSSSLKYQLINMENEEVLASGKYERIGENEAFITHKVNGQKIEIQHPAKTHEEAVDFTLKQLVNPEYKVIDSLDEISAIGHRLLNGGEKILMWISVLVVVLIFLLILFALLMQVKKLFRKFKPGCCSKGRICSVWLWPG